MKKRFFAGSLSALLFAFAMIGNPWPTVSAQEEAAGNRLNVESAERNSSAMQGLAVEKPSATRLPSGYRNITTAEQKLEIAKIQKEYAELIDLLELRVLQLRIERDKKIDALLDEHQTRRIRQARGHLESDKYTMEKKPRAPRQSRRRTAPAPAPALAPTVAPLVESQPTN